MLADALNPRPAGSAEPGASAAPASAAGPAYPAIPSLNELVARWGARTLVNAPELVVAIAAAFVAYRRVPGFRDLVNRLLGLSGPRR